MIEASIPTLVLIAAIAVISPLLAERLRRFNVPDVVLELAFGIIVGPYVLKLAHTNDVVNGLSDIGLAFLMFLAGYELDLQGIRGRPLRLASLGWLLSLGMAFAFALVSTGLAVDTLVVGLALTTTALGTLLPMLRDAGLLETRFGAYIVAIGTAGEFGPIVAVAVLLTRKDPFVTSALLVFFVAIAVACALLASRTRPPRMVALLRRHLHSSAQLPVRVSVLLVLVLVYLAFELGLDVLLGAFAAGVVVKLFTVGEDSEVIKGKLEAIGFGFLIPIFFIVSGIHFDLHVFLTRPTALLRIPLFLALFLVIRGLPALLLYRTALPRDERVPLALFSATGLPLIVVITSLGVSQGRMLPENAAALVGAGMLSVLLLPMLGLNRLRRSGEVDPDAPRDSHSAFGRGEEPL
ncbi:MAG TPA: cation:proton antiporter [Acidimicrobiales bacterium]|nr:cation:proton antiporter [Acidimicrobiales bacterium]